MPKHIRNRNNRQNKPAMEKVGDELKMLSAKMGYHIRAPSQSVGGWVMAILMILILGVVIAHYMGYITLPGPLGKIPRKAAPPSHLQYFFF
jgi:hypothetical protein